MNIKEKTYIFDFDKTIVSIECLEVLAEISLVHNPQNEKRTKQIRRITEQGMNGIIPFGESLKKRFALFTPTDENIQETLVRIKHSITPSILRNMSFFRNNAEQIYIVSGGFKEFIIPVAQILGIPKDHVFANTMKKDRKGNIIGFDTHNPLSKDGGKIIVAQRLQKRHIVVIGDGYTDAQVKTMGVAKRFIAFTEHVARKNVIKLADGVARSFEEIIF